MFWNLEAAPPGELPGDRMVMPGSFRVSPTRRPVEEEEQTWKGREGQKGKKIHVGPRRCIAYTPCMDSSPSFTLLRSRYINVPSRNTRKIESPPSAEVMKLQRDGKAAGMGNGNDRHCEGSEATIEGAL